MGCSAGTGGSVESTDPSGGWGRAGPVPVPGRPRSATAGPDPGRGVRRPRDAGHTPTVRDREVQLSAPPRTSRARGRGRSGALQELQPVPGGVVRVDPPKAGEVGVPG